MRKFTLRSFVVLALSMCACTKTDFNGDDGNPQPGSGLVGGGPYYMSFRLEMADGPDTRADYEDESGNQFEYGSEAEYAIRNFMILFFDKDYRQVYHVTSAEQTPTDGQEDIEKEFGKLITISLDSDDDKLGEKLASVTSYVTILNYNPAWDDDKYFFYDLPLYDPSPTNEFYLNKFHCGYKYPIEIKDGWFVMSTAGHYISEEDDRYIFYDTCNAETSPIFYDTASEAKENPVEITVERLAARVDMDFQPEIEPIEVLYGTDVYELTFDPDRWGLEAEEKDEFIMKNQRELKRTYNDPRWNYPLNYGDWIDYKQHRTFWAESPTFSGSTYPYAWRGDEYETGSNVSLLYTTFKNLSRLTRTSDDGFAETSCYTTEHTFDVSELNKAGTKNPYAVPTSVVVGGRYKATYVTTDEKYLTGEPPTSSKSEGDELNLKGEGFYIRFIDMERTDEVSDPSKKYQYRLYREKNDKDTDDLYEALLKEQFVIFYLGADDGYYPVNAEIFSNDGKSTALEIFEIANTYANQYTLQLKSNIDESILAGLFYAYYDDSEKRAEYVPLQFPDDITKANNLLKKQLGYAQRYWKGHAFFYAPIPHYTGKNSPFRDGDSYSYSGLFNYKKNDGKYEKGSNGNYIVDHKNGEFGVVRNHIYKITIDRISTLGQGIPNEDAIPLPEPRIDHELYQFDLSLKVLPWNQFKYTFDI